MKIFLFDHHNTEYPVKGYGGIQRINQYLFKGLVDLGLDVTLVVNNSPLFAYKHGRVISLSFDEINDIRWGRKKIVSITGTESGVIFHSHTSGHHQSFDFSDFKGVWTATCHGQNEDTNCDFQIFVSHSQMMYHVLNFDILNKLKHPESCLNGIDFDTVLPVGGSHDKIIWFSHICPAKAPHIICQLADKLSIPLILAGNISDNDYYEAYIKKWVYHKNITYVGTINSDRDKAELFSNGRVYFHSALTHESCATTILESQAYGVPVIAFNVGGNLEIMNSSKGIVKDDDDIVYKLNNFFTQDRAGLVNWTRNKFSKEAMAKRYYYYWLKHIQ